jgi:hypothetical protein
VTGRSLPRGRRLAPPQDRQPAQGLLAIVAAALGAVAMLAGPASSVVLAADPVFGKPTIEGKFGDGLQLTQPVTLDGTPTRVEVLITFANANGPLVVEVPPPTASGPVTLRYQVSVAADGHILPNTPLSARWRITPRNGKAVVGPVAKILYADERFDWQTVSGDLVRVHWYEGGAAFGNHALQIGEKAVRDTSSLLGVTEKDPIDFFVYADQQAFYDALGPGTRENVGGQANAEIRTMFALITPAEIDQPWVDVVVPHELTHLVFDTAVRNPYHFPPRWLNEGLAVYLSEGYTASYRSDVEAAARDGSLIPLDGLVGQFPTGQGFFQAYAESVSALDFFIRTYGQDALVSLIGSYADGRTDDEAFKAAIGIDTVGFNDAWLADLGATAPVRSGPKPAPPGPVPSAWGGTGSVPGATTPPGGQAPTGSAAPGSTPSPGDATPPSSQTTILGLALVTIAVLGAAVLLAWSRSRRGRPDTIP